MADSSCHTGCHRQETCNGSAKSVTFWYDTSSWSRYVVEVTVTKQEPLCCASRSPAAGGEEDESDDDSLMPAVNLSNRLNPNNVHFDRQLAAQYKRMSKHEKEALWAADRARQHQLRELTELSQMAGLNAAELSQLTELTQVSLHPCSETDAITSQDNFLHGFVFVPSLQDSVSFRLWVSL